MWRKPLPQWKISGIPAAFYTDHGRDFISEHLEQVSADLEMALVFSEPGMPRGRGKIERFFRTVNELLLCGLPGYTPAGMPPDHAVFPSRPLKPSCSGSSWTSIISVPIVKRVSRHVSVQVVKTRITQQLAPSDCLREAETEPLHPAGRLHMRR